jgi:MoxR-like ATPase
LYYYDAIGHVRSGKVADGTDPEPAGVDYGPAGIGRFIRLGPLGTALLPWRRPRVLLIDELDKCDIDLPNDLLHVLENGWFRIRELARLAAGSNPRPVHVLSDDDLPVRIERGRVHCTEFPFVVMTSNQERTFPPALMRRCLPLELAPPNHDQLTAIVDKLIGNDDDTRAEISRFVERLDDGHLLATDQLLNLVYLRGLSATDCALPDEVRAAVTRELTG